MLRYAIRALAVVIALPVLLVVAAATFVIVEEHVVLKECRVAEKAQFQLFVYRCEHLWWSWGRTARSQPFDDYWPTRLPIWAANEQCRSEVRTRVAKEHCDRKYDPHAPRV